MMISPKKIVTILLSALYVALFSACDNETADMLSISSANNKAIVSLPGVSCSQAYRFTTNGDWAVSCSDPDISIAPMQGKAGTDSVIVSSSKLNCTNDPVESSFTIDVTNALYSIKQNVTISLQPVFKLKETSYTAAADGDTLYVKFHCDGDVSAGVYVYYDTDFHLMFDADNSQMQKCAVTRSDDDTEYNCTMKIAIRRNTLTSTRTGKFFFSLDRGKTLTSVEMTATQLASGIGESTDTVSANGKVTLLHEHSLGNGVPVVLLGDGFIDKDIESGKYRAAMTEACGYLFDIEPMKSLQQYFDVYEVTAVSKNNYFSNYTSTAFSSVFGGGTLITGDDDKAVLYAKKAVKNIDDALIIVVLNDSRYAGTCALYTDGKKSDIPSGHSVAYVPMVDSQKNGGIGFAEVLHHEAIGHGFAKLADEYSEHGVITAEATAELKTFQSYGFSRNVSLYSDVAKSWWADFAADSRYAGEALSCYEGAYTYLKGVWRPTVNSIMNDNSGAFNAPSRCMIYKRCMSIALGSAWAYDYETFASFDAPSRNAAATSASVTTRSAHTATRPRLASPIIHIRK